MTNINKQRIFWGNILRKLRYDHELTQNEIAEILHMTRQNYSNIECGKRQPSAETIAILSDLYEVDLYNYIINLMPNNYVAELDNYKVYVKNVKKPRKKKSSTGDQQDN
ncbi:Helix-turn-helix domain-containing protein [Lachnospiraceae bacterium]|nr:Helix-turn-helix domain-containing protein [Lachnospiraceae bacterium]